MKDAKKKSLKKELKKYFFWGTLTGGAITLTTGNFIVSHSSINKNTKKVYTQPDTEEGKKLYEQYKKENNDIIKIIYQYYEKAAATIYENSLAVIVCAQNGYLVIDENGIFKCVSFDGIMYDSPNDLFAQIPFEEVSETKKEEAIERIMGIEKQTSFSIDHFTLLSEVKDGNLLQTIYKEDVDGFTPIARGKLYKTPYGYQSIYTSLDGMIQADNLAMFAVLYDHKALYVSQQMQDLLGENKTR